MQLLRLRRYYLSVPKYMGLTKERSVKSSRVSSTTLALTSNFQAADMPNPALLATALSSGAVNQSFQALLAPGRAPCSPGRRHQPNQVSNPAKYPR